jgi:hypothetical protein
MSENKQNQTRYFASGVFKVDYRVAGYKDLLEVARDWASKDSNFLYLSVRTVSQQNYGIEFIYSCNVEAGEKDDFNPMKDYKNQLLNMFGKSNENTHGVYAWDYNQLIYESDQDLPESVIKFEGLR